MGLDNPLHIAFLLMILLLVFGAKRLPELGRSLGTGMRGFKDSLTGEGESADHTAEITAGPASAPATVGALSTVPAVDETNHEQPEVPSAA